MANIKDAADFGTQKQKAKTIWLKKKRNDYIYEALKRSLLLEKRNKR